MGKIALFGAAGAIGKSIATALQQHGIPYRVVGRSAASLQRAFGGDPHAEIRTWNPDDPASVCDAASGIDTIIYLVGVNYWQFQLHPELMRKTLDGATAAGVRRLLLIGTVYPYGRPQTPTVTEDHPRSPHTFKGRMRKEQEDLLFAVRQAGQIQTCELRLPDFFGPGVDKSFLWSAFQAAKNGGRAQLIGPVDTPHQFVFVPDVGPIVVRLLSTEAAWGHAWNFAGSGILTQREFVDKIFAAAGRPPKFMVAGKLMLRALGIFNPLLRELVEMHYLQTTPVLLDDSRLTQLLGGVERTSYDEGILQTLATMPAGKSS
ncbi:NAD-dependent epimerase/dehydratase family protein [Acidipila sp. 4G-K13]|uniref:NAD-dependent epimerase/dehydratase family protein n=2 Tax=Paracidobacterium acidisoli TaxID=2303751 RepID=A0A372IQE5_9BACT|nr:NAD-dependent epimerase/dehydratase family protein [Paracidobacterium acidisoli]